MTEYSLKWESPFLSNHALRNIGAIEIEGVKLVAQDLLNFQQGIGGELVVSNPLRINLTAAYNNYLVVHGKPPDAIRSVAYPEKLFIPHKITTTRIIEGASRPIFVPETMKVLVFFAVPKKF